MKFVDHGKLVIFNFTGSTDSYFKVVCSMNFYIKVPFDTPTKFPFIILYPLTKNRRMERQTHV